MALFLESTITPSSPKISLVEVTVGLIEVASELETFTVGILSEDFILHEEEGTNETKTEKTKAFLAKTTFKLKQIMQKIADLIRSFWNALKRKLVGLATRIALLGKKVAVPKFAVDAFHIITGFATDLISQARSLMSKAGTDKFNDSLKGVTQIESKIVELRTKISDAKESDSVVEVAVGPLASKAIQTVMKLADTVGDISRQIERMAHSIKSDNPAEVAHARKYASDLHHLSTIMATLSNGLTTQVMHAVHLAKSGDLAGAKEHIDGVFSGGKDHT